jgi:hypothetical protein
MTIGIGVLFSSKPRPHPIRPDGLILIADTMGSTETDSTAELHKLWIEDNLYAAGAGNLILDEEVISLFKLNLAKVPARTHGHIWDALNRAVLEHLQTHFTWDVLAPKYLFAPGTVFESQKENVTKEWQEYEPQLSMLVGTFHEKGHPLLYLVSRDENGVWVHSYPYPGHAVIGSGARNAHFWLKFRDQHFGMNPKQSAYHAYEAKIMAARAPTVNSNTEIVVAFSDRHYVLSAEHPSPEGCPVSLTELQTAYLKYGPQDTNPLGHKVSSKKTSGGRSGASSIRPL